jgi:BASS family bile acid:Na+ symporter
MQLDTLVQAALALGLIVIMFGIGLSLTGQDFLNVFTYRTPLFVGLVAQIVGLPLAAVFTIHVFDVSPEYALGLMIIASSPGGATSNLFSYLMKGDVALSVSLTAFSSVICLFSVPLILTYASQLLLDSSAIIRLPPEKIFLPLLFLVLSPLLVGMIIRSRFPVWAIKMHRPTSLFSVLILVSSIAYLFYLEHQRFLAYAAELGGVISFFFVLAALVGYTVSRTAKLGSRQTRTILIEVGVQNGMQAIVIATSPLIFNNPVLAIPAAIYSILMYLFVSTLYLGTALTARYKCSY